MDCTQPHLSPFPDLSSSSENMSLSTDSPNFFSEYLLHETRLPLHKMDSRETLSRSSCLYFLPLNLHDTWRNVDFPCHFQTTKKQKFTEKNTYTLSPPLLYLHPHVTLSSPISKMATLQTVRSHPF